MVASGASAAGPPTTRARPAGASPAPTTTPRLALDPTADTVTTPASVRRPFFGRPALGQSGGVLPAMDPRHGAGRLRRMLLRGSSACWSSIAIQRAARQQYTKQAVSYNVNDDTSSANRLPHPPPPHPLPTPPPPPSTSTQTVPCSDSGLASPRVPTSATMRRHLCTPIAARPPKRPLHVKITPPRPPRPLHPLCFQNQTSPFTDPPPQHPHRPHAPSNRNLRPRTRLTTA